MKRILTFLSMVYCFTTNTYAQTCPPRGGDEETPGGGGHETVPLDSATVTDRGGFSMDPNELIGPDGFGAARWVSINDILNYTIMFENDSTLATAPAMTVDVRFDFDNKSTMKGFGLGRYGFANYSWDINGRPSAYQTRLNLLEEMDIYVDFVAGLDLDKKQAFWTFRSLDPITGALPWQIDHGMLPVNDSTHVGEGYVTFTIVPPTTMKTGDTLSLAANILFDQNDVIPTNRWCNTIDAGIPTSKVSVKQDSKNEILHHITISGEDDKGGSGLKQVVLYQANNFGIYEKYAICPNDTVIDFMAEPGHQYQFYALAEDNVGNREQLKEKPDFVINLNAPPTDIQISDSIFQDDIEVGGFIAELTSEDIETSNGFVYSLTEGDGAIHNDLFQINGSQLQAKTQFKCADNQVYKIRLSTTDEGGLSYSKAFTLNLQNVLDKPKPDTVNVSICDGDVYEFHGREYEKSGIYRYAKSNDNMCDSLYVLNLMVLPSPEKPQVTVEGTHTMVSSNAHGNQWYHGDGTPVEGATGQKFTPLEDGIYYVTSTNGACSATSESYMVRMSDNMQLTLDLKEGWNWISSNLSEANNQDSKEFLKPIENVTSSFVGATGQLTNDQEKGLTGNLTTIVPSEGYKLDVIANVTHSWNGIGSRPENVKMKLHQGWNWIGYVPVAATTLSSALENLEPTENDIIKSQDEFAIFSGGKWTGSLVSLSPGVGYMYYANAAKEFNYTSSRVFPTNPESESFVLIPSLAPWNFDIHKYPDNSTIIGKVFANGEPVEDGCFIVGAFVGDECRGICKYLDGLIFLTIHGNGVENSIVHFRAYETVSGNTFDINETMAFSEHNTGTLSQPFALHFEGETDIDEATMLKFNIYPRPLHDRLYVQGDTERIKNIKVLATNGATVIQTDRYNSDEGIDVNSIKPGVYLVGIVTDSGQIYYEKVIKVLN